MIINRCVLHCTVHPRVVIMRLRYAYDKNNKGTIFV